MTKSRKSTWIVFALLAVCVCGFCLGQEVSSVNQAIDLPTTSALVSDTPSKWDEERGALIVEQPHLSKEGKGYRGTLWLDGAPIQITPETRLLSAPASTTFRFLLFRGWHVRPWYHDKAKVPFSDALLAPNTWAIYHPGDTADGRLAATQLRLWPNQIGAQKQAYLDMYAAQVQPPDYAKRIAGVIRYKKNAPIKILPDHGVQDWVTQLGMQLVPPYQKALPDTDPTKIHFRFLVVYPFTSTSKNYLMDINGAALGHGMVAFWDYRSPKKGSMVEDVLAMPDGTILIPSVALARMSTTSEVAALLSYAVTSIVQQQGYITWSMATRLIGHPLIAGNGDPSFLSELLQWQDDQVVRIGIRQMFLAGYDIRDAPFVWAIAEGRPLHHPMLDRAQYDKDTPWYATYASSCISLYYSNVDYSKLKRGEADYQEFLGELRKAAPEAFSDHVLPTNP